MTQPSEIDQDVVDEWLEEDAGAAEEDEPIPPALTSAEKYAQSQLRVVRESKDYTLDYLQHALRPGREIIDIAPSFQRRLRWTRKRKSLLIESFLLNIPVPPIFLFERDYNEYEVIDGRQRLDTIRAFLANEFPLLGLEYWSELNGKRFEDLPGILKKGLLRRSLSAVVLLAETRGNADDGQIDVRRVLFDRLNTGGVRLNPQELRNALYPGSLNKLLIELASSEIFTTVWGIPRHGKDDDDELPEALLKNALFASLADAELVLRVFALQDALANGRQGSLRRILDRYMSDNSDLPEDRLGPMRREFLYSLTRLSNVIGDRPFTLPTTSRPSRPMYDALMIALMRQPSLPIEENERAVTDALGEALEDVRSYELLVGRGNTIEAIRERVELASGILSSQDR